MKALFPVEIGQHPYHMVKAEKWVVDTASQTSKVKVISARIHRARQTQGCRALGGTTPNSLRATKTDECYQAEGCSAGVLLLDVI